MSDVREFNLTLDLCLRIGELLLSSGAGAADVTATMDSVARHLGLRGAEIDVTFTSLTMSYAYEDELAPLVAIRQVKQREIDYEDLTAVDHLVTDILTDRADLYLARSRMATIVTTGHARPRWRISFGWGLMCSGVAVMLGGEVVVVSIAFLAAVTIHRAQLMLSRRRLPSFYQQVVGGMIATAFAGGVAALDLDVRPSLVVTSTIIMLLAGVGFMGALQDALTGFYVTSGARMIEALLATAGIVGGVSGGLTIASLLGLDLGRVDPGWAASLDRAGLLVLGAAVCAGAFAYACHAPKRIVVPIGLIAGSAVALFNGVIGAGFDRPWAAAVAAFWVGLTAYPVAGWVRVPPLVIVVSAVVPMLPGLSIYRGLSLLAEGGTQSTAGLLAMITAASIAIALSAGVILGEYVAQPLNRQTKRLEARLSGPRLVGPFRARGLRH